MSPSVSENRIGGICFTRQFPNPAEPLRGTFVAQQVDATAPNMDWRVIAPVAWPLRHRRASIPHTAMRGGIPIAYPRYPVLPRRLLFGRVGASMAKSASPAFAAAVSALPNEHAFVHAHELYPSGLAASLLAAKAALPLVLSVHGSDLYTNLAQPEWKGLIARAARSAARVVCVSTSLSQDLVREVGVDPRRVVVVPDTYDAHRFSVMQRAPVSSDERVHLVTVGRLSREKGVDVFVEALALMRDRGASVSATIVGDGPQRSSLERLVAERGLTDTVRFAGALSDDRLVAELACAHLYVQPSRREGFGVALVEALATGLPVVATDSGGPRDIVSGGDGVLCAPDDAEALANALRTVIADLGSFDAPAIAHRAFVRFGPEAVGAMLLGVYREVLEEARQ